jgi:hypothetical protein
MTFAALTIDINAKIANLETGIKRTEEQLKGLANRADTAGKAVTSAFAFIGVGSLVAAFTSKIVGLVEEMANLDDASEKIGSSVESISETFNKFKVGGGTLDELTAAGARLVKSMQGADEESKGAGEAFANLGVKIKDASGNLRDPITVLNEIATALTKYDDSATKTAYAQAIFGKSGAELLPKLKDLATETGSLGKITAEQAAAAEELQKALRRLSIEADFLKQQFLSGIIPTLINMVEQFRAGKEAAGGFFAALGMFGLALPGNPADKLKGLREERDRIIASIEKTQNSVDNDTFFGGAARKKASNNIVALTADLAKLQKQIGYYQLLERQQIAIEGSAQDANDQRAKAKPILPGLKSNGKTDAKDSDPAKALEALAKERVRIFLDEQKRIASEAQFFLDDANARGLFSIQGYFDKRLAIAKLAYDEERGALSKLIEEQERSVKTSKSDPKKLAEATKELEISQAKRNTLDREFAFTADKALVEKRKATQEYTDSISALNAELLGLKGNSAASALDAFDKRVRVLKAQADANKNPIDQKLIDDLRMQVDLNAQLADLNQKRAVIEQNLATETARVQASVTVGAATEYAASVKLGELRQAAVPELQRISEAYGEIAGKIGSPKVLADAAALKASTEDLARSADTLREKYLGISEGAFQGVLDDLKSGSKSAIDIAKDMVVRILFELAKLEFAGLGRKGAASLFDLFKGFGGGGDVPFEYSGSGFAMGGSPPVGQASWVGERGPELFIPNSAGKIIPNNALGGGGTTIVQNFDMRGSSDSANLVRQAAALGAASARASIYDERKRGGKAFA